MQRRLCGGVGGADAGVGAEGEGMRKGNGVGKKINIFSHKFSFIFSKMIRNGGHFWIKTVKKEWFF